MKLALFGINNGLMADPDIMRSVSVAAEAAGFESVWTGEHVVLPDPQVPPSPAPPLMPMLHPSTALSYIAAVTTTLKLGTGITLIAQRNPVVLAKEMASLDQLSKGRLLFGVGAGYLEPEFNALGVNFAERGARTDEYIDAMRELWTAEHPQFAGKFVNYSGIQSRPLAYQAGGPPVIVGGSSSAAYRRAITRGQGWYGFSMTEKTSAACIASLGEMAQKFDRPESLGKLEISITPRTRLTDELLASYDAMGVDRLILLQVGKTEEELLAFVDDIGNRFLK